MLRDICSPEYNRQEALDLWRVRVLERTEYFNRSQFSGPTGYDIALAFFFGLNFTPIAAKALAEQVTTEHET